MPIPSAESRVELSDGRSIRLCYYADIPDRSLNDGWRVDDIDIYVNDQAAGYLKMAYIPKCAFDRYYSNALAYACRLEGRHLGLRPSLDTPVDEMSIEELRGAVFTLEKEDYWRSVSIPGDEVSREELVARYDVRVKQIMKSCRKRYLSFRDWQMDNPVVDYVRVYEEGDDVQIAGKVIDVSPRRYRGQGLGKILYLAGAMAMHDQGMSLRASDLQTESAAAAWARLETEGLVEKRRTKTEGRSYSVINGDEALRRYPQFRLPVIEVPEQGNLVASGLSMF